MEKKKTDTIKQQSRVRLWFQAAWFVLTNSYMRGYTNGKIYTGGTKVLCVPGLNCYSCPGALGSCPMGALQAVLGDPTYRVSLYVFGLLAAMGVLFGRLICGWMCPFGLVQDLLYKIKVKTKKKNLPGHQYLKYLRYVILVIFPLLAVWVVSGLTGTTEPWFCELICPSGTLLGGVPLVLLSSSLCGPARESGSRGRCSCSWSSWCCPCSTTGRFASTCARWVRCTVCATPSLPIGW